MYEENATMRKKRLSFAIMWFLVAHLLYIIRGQNASFFSSDHKFYGMAHLLRISSRWYQQTFVREAWG